MSSIPRPVTKTAGGRIKIPQKVNEVSQETEAPEAMPYVISFATYNDKVGNLSVLKGNKAKKTLEVLKKVGTEIRSPADYQKYSLQYKPVRRDGEYKKLFSGLPDDVDLKEIKLQGKSRIFHFSIESKRVFYVVAITENHLETNKVRR
ncbi:MAG: hypothetical protein OYG31_02590 [Candidatus Kaiserbacteria bacterium]|nr:hypothetical protein [Candidatus Kaiserbacteria bacterium]